MSKLYLFFYQHVDRIFPMNQPACFYLTSFSMPFPFPPYTVHILNINYKLLYVFHLLIHIQLAFILMICWCIDFFFNRTRKDAHSLSFPKGLFSINFSWALKDSSDYDGGTAFQILLLPWESSLALCLEDFSQSCLFVSPVLSAFSL